jgi:hypothetical protein
METWTGTWILGKNQKNPGNLKKCNLPGIYLKF